MYRPYDIERSGELFAMEYDTCITRYNLFFNAAFSCCVISYYDLVNKSAM